MNRMTSIAALACAFALTAVSPALSQYEGKNPVKGVETDSKIDKARQEEMKKQDSSGRSSTNQPGVQDYPANSVKSGMPGSGKEESNIVREGVDNPPLK